MRFLAISICFLFSLSLSAATLRETVAQLKNTTDPHGQGRHTHVSTTSASALEMVREYIAAKYDDNGRDFVFLEEQTTMPVDEMKAGTLKTEAVAPNVSKALKGWYDDDDTVDLRAMLRATSALLKDLHEDGVVFGFDGFWQNSCAAPTVMLLVISQTSRDVYGIDLNPCEE